jgi:MOSC domain-containing protein YiiM
MNAYASSRVEAIFAGGPRTLHDERGAWRSSISKQPVLSPAEVTLRGLVGDKANLPIHGGPDAALCIHLSSHYDFWNAHLGVALRPGAVGENLTVADLAEDDVSVGDIVRIGSVLAQVSGPRVPCTNQARYVGRKDWVKLTIRENRTGFYMRVLEPGALSVGDPWLLQERRHEDASIPRINRCMYLSFDPAFAQRMTGMTALTDWWKQQAAEKLAAREPHWTESMQSK